MKNSLMKYLPTLLVYMYYVRGFAAKRKRNLRDRVGSVLPFCLDRAGPITQSRAGLQGKSWTKSAYYVLIFMLMWQGNTLMREKGNHVVDSQSITFPLMGIKGNGLLLVLMLYVAMSAAFSGCLRLSY